MWGNGKRNSGCILFLAGMICLLGMTACQRQHADTRAADFEAVKNVDAQWSKAASAHDLDATMGYYSDDAVLLAPNVPIATDRQSIRSAWAALLTPDNAVSWQAKRVDVARSGELAYVVGTYVLTSKDGKGKTATDHGKTMEIFKKQADGSWKAVADMYSSDMAAPPA